jgi:hypothetical protein
MSIPIIKPFNLSEIPDFNNLVNGTITESKILKLQQIECRTSDKQKYSVIRYLKEFLCLDMIPTYGLCRSIILNSANVVVGFAPPKSIPSDTFIKRHPDKTAHLVAQEFIEGTMINAFWDPSVGLAGGWEISTRNTVGATSSFFKGANRKTFRDMFLEAAKEVNLSLDKLNKDLCYSFVLQHPENRIVVPFKKPDLYLVALYNIKIVDGNTMVMSYPMSDLKNFDWGPAAIKFPEIYEWNTYTELIEKYASMNTSYSTVGVVVYNNLTCERMKIRNPVYEQVRNLRGNQPKLQYQYLSLRKEGKVADFLKFYPENKKEFSAFRDQVHLFTSTLFANYASCYIKKEKPLKEFSDQYRTHMFNIHKIYMDELREKKFFVTNTTVINYVNNLHPSLLMYCLNFQMRKRNVDTIAADNNI